MSSNDDFDPPEDPWTLFHAWFQLAAVSEPRDPDAMALATADEAGAPSVRMVLLKGYSEGVLDFFSNRESRKGRQLAANGKAAICLHWKSLNRQIRAEGSVELMDDERSDRYFASRPRFSQLGAWASDQSRPLPTRALLEDRLRDAEKRFEGQDVPRPPYWGGYCLTPLRLEFWQDRAFRLHDRIVYARGGLGGLWVQERLYP